MVTRQSNVWHLLISRVDRARYTDACPLKTQGMLHVAPFTNMV